MLLFWGTPAGGRGVGLTIGKRVIQAHGGTIEAESNGVKGAKIVVRLPKTVLLAS